MPKRTFVYRSSGVVETTPAENIALCEEISADAAERKKPIEFGLPRNHPNWRNASGTWPMASDTFGCSDIEAVKIDQKLLAEKGVKTEYDAEYRPIFTSRAHKKAHLRALGYADPDAGYGDAEPLYYHSGIKRHDATNPAHRSARLEKARQELIAKEYKLFGCRVSNL